MQRRSFFGLVWASLTVLFGLLAVRPVFDGGAVDLGYGATAVVNGGIAGLYWLYSEPIADPDQPAPRRWFELAGIVLTTLVGSYLLLYVTLG